MFNEITQCLKNLSIDTRIALGLFLFTVCTFTGVTLFIGHIDSRSLEPERGTPFTYPVVHSDSEGYTQVAVNMLEHGVYSTSSLPPYEKEINWAPGYPFLIASSLFLFKSTVPVALLQIVLAGITAILMYRISTRFVQKRIAVIPALVYALDPSIAYYTGTIQTDGLFMCLITILIYILFCTERKRHSLLFFFLVGILLGYSALVRTISQYLVIVLPILYFVWVSHEEPWKSLFFKFSTFCIGFLLIVVPWMFRNHTVFDSFTVGNIGPKMLLQYYVKDFLTLKKSTGLREDYATSDSAHGVAEQIDTELNERVTAEGGTKESHYGSVALTHIFADPLGYTKFHTIGTLPYFFAGSYRHFIVSIQGYYKERAGLPHPHHENVAHRMTSVLFSGNMTEIASALRDLSVVLIDIAWRSLILILALFAFLVPERRHKIFIGILWVLVCYFALLTGPAALTRYRIVSEPLLLSLAAIGGWHVYVFQYGTILRIHDRLSTTKHVS
jgi:4-amino-4-deoxy-L-arabinose transferase-like glycosyltransferase